MSHDGSDCDAFYSLTLPMDDRRRGMVAYR